MTDSKHQPEAIMCCSVWLNRGTAIGLLLGLLLGGGGAFAWFQSREQPKETAKTEAPKPEVPEPKNVKKEEVAPPIKPERPIQTPAELEAAKQKAQLGCRAVSQAIEAYLVSSSNPGLSDEEKMPQDISNLYNVPFGGSSFLRKGKDDTIDPWGKSYLLVPMYRHDGSLYLLVLAIAPDGAPISDFGIGVEKAFTKFKK